MRQLDEAIRKFYLRRKSISTFKLDINDMDEEALIDKRHRNPFIIRSGFDSMVDFIKYKFTRGKLHDIVIPLRLPYHHEPINLKI